MAPRTSPPSSFSPAPSLRPPDAADYAALAAWVPDAESCARWAGPRLQFPFSPQQLPQLLAEPGAHSFALSRGSTEALGFCQFWVREAGVAHLARIILAPAARGQGLASTMCSLLMAEAVRTVDAQAFTLRVYRDNHRALATYEGLGFVTVSARSDERVFFMRAVR